MRFGKQIQFFALQLRIRRAPMMFYEQVERNELFLSPHRRLAGIPGMAHIESENLAKELAEAVLPTLKKRYGDDTDVELGRWTTTEDKRLLARIEKDSAIIREWLENNPKSN